MNCQYCGKPLPPKKPHGPAAKYCSEECRRKADESRKHERRGRRKGRERVNREARICPTCGTEFIPYYEAQKFCSYPCSVKDRHDKAVLYQCKHCGKTFHPYKNRYTTFCSRECAYAYKAAHAVGRKPRPKPAAPPREQVCPECGKRFTTKHYRKYCSPECAYHAWYKPAETVNPEVVHTCAWCGRTFTTKRYSARRKYCSRTCAESASRAANPDARLLQKWRRRERMVESAVESFDRRGIFERDGWVCQICGKRVDPGLKYPHPMSASLDHIVPLAKGGTHEPRNVQLAHLVCNVAKGVGGNDQLRLFG